MELNSFEVLNEIRLSVYRATMKLQSVQRLCHMDLVSVRHITAAIRSVGGPGQLRDVRLNRQEIIWTLNRMFHSASQEVSGHVTAVGPEETCSLMFRLFNRSEMGHSQCDPASGSAPGSVPATALHTALIALSSDNLLQKYRGLLSVCEDGSGCVSISGFRSLLQDLSQVPAAVQEEAVFGSVEEAVASCFNGVLTQMVSKEHLLSWLQSEPRLLLWLPTLYRLSISQNIRHGVRCHTCKTRPLTGLRYRCMKCVNVHVCQNCFLTEKHTRKHKSWHPVMEYCTQPTWRESLCSLVDNARHALLPRRHSQREADRRQVLMWAEPGETLDRAPPPPDTSTRFTDPAVHSPSSDRDVFHDVSVRPSASSKALQTDEEMEEIPIKQASALMAEVRNLLRDKWLLEQEIQAWRLTVQSEHDVLEDRCSEMEVTMETFRQHNLHLQSMLTQALDKMETHQHISNMPHGVAKTIERHSVTPYSDSQDDDKEEELLDDLSESPQQTPSPAPSIHQGMSPSHDLHCKDEEEGLAEDRGPCHPIGQEDGLEVAEIQQEDFCLSEEENKEDEDCGMYSPEELLQDTVSRLKTEMEKDGWTERQTGKSRKWAELLEAADQVGNSVHHLVVAMRTSTSC